MFNAARLHAVPLATQSTVYTVAVHTIAIIGCIIRLVGAVVMPYALTSAILILGPDTRPRFRTTHNDAANHSCSLGHEIAAAAPSRYRQIQAG